MVIRLRVDAIKVLTQELLRGWQSIELLVMYFNRCVKYLPNVGFLKG